METPQPSNLIVTSIEVGIVKLELDRPNKRNALSQDLIDELTETLYQINRNPAVRVVVLTSSGTAPFCGEYV